MQVEAILKHLNAALKELNDLKQLMNSEGTNAFKGNNYGVAERIAKRATIIEELGVTVQDVTDKLKRLSLEVDVSSSKSKARIVTKAKPRRKHINRNIPQGQWLEVEFTYKHATAYGRYRSSQFILLEGSTITVEYYDSLREQLLLQRLELIEQGVLEQLPNPEIMCLKEDISFGSASAAAQFVCGYSINGLDCWKVRTTKQSINEYLRAFNRH